MADRKKSFIACSDVIDCVAGMTDAQIGQLYKAQLRYANGLEPGIADAEVKGLWRVIKKRMDEED